MINTLNKIKAALVAAGINNVCVGISNVCVGIDEIFRFPNDSVITVIFGEEYTAYEPIIEQEKISLPFCLDFAITIYSPKPCDSDIVSKLNRHFQESVLPAINGISELECQFKKSQIETDPLTGRITLTWKIRAVGARCIKKKG